ncbi:MAG: rod shape-determining protein MreC [Candidatus Liptonbacteria bacterium]
MINRWLIGGALLAILALLFLPAASWRIQNMMRYGFSFDADDSNILLAENMRLEAELAKLGNSAGIVSEAATDMIPAFVYSRYPTPFKNELMLSAGEEQGVKVGAAVIFPLAGNKNFLIGKISRVWPEYSSVQTIFDKEFKMAVRIGKNGTDSLLSGGAVPRLTLIPKAKPIEPGQVVYCASQDAPYGAPVGEISAVTLIPETAMQEAELSVPYDPNAIHAVLIKKKGS